MMMEEEEVVYKQASILVSMNRFESHIHNILRAWKCMGLASTHLYVHSGAFN